MDRDETMSQDRDELINLLEAAAALVEDCSSRAPIKNTDRFAKYRRSVLRVPEGSPGKPQARQNRPEDRRSQTHHLAR
jgi:hypothetical protein